MSACGAPVIPCSAGAGVAIDSVVGARSIGAGAGAAIDWSIGGGAGGGGSSVDAANADVPAISDAAKARLTKLLLDMTIHSLPRRVMLTTMG
jgi:hypothetical protein